MSSAAGSYCYCEQSQVNEPPSALSSQQPTFTPDQVAQRNGQNHAATWVTYQGKVYDITKFIAQHPGGGSMIRQAAGGSIEPYWNYWAYHTALQGPMDTLQEYEIGELKIDIHENEQEDSKDELEEDFYEHDPDRDRCRENGQVQLVAVPWCSETHPSKLTKSFTPNESFYVRNHAPVPALDAKDHSIGVQFDEKSIAVDLERLKSDYPIVMISSTLQCSGNRASEMIALAPTSFSQTPFRKIQTGMLGNAIWTGVKLSDVLLKQFPQLKNDHHHGHHHVEFEGADGYVTSVPLSRLLDPSYDALLCWEMNGEPLPPDHGYPVRVLLPGITGARSVKWIISMRIQPNESESTFTQHYYKDPNGKAIQEMPLQSFITSKTTIQGSNEIHVQGVAWGGASGTGISKVEVALSNSDGKKVDWMPTTLDRSSNYDSSRLWSWVIWRAVIPFDHGGREVPKVTCRATNGKGEEQPEKFWYPKGYLYNGWHSM